MSHEWRRHRNQIVRGTRVSVVHLVYPEKTTGYRIITRFDGSTEPAIRHDPVFIPKQNVRLPPRPRQDPLHEIKNRWQHFRMPAPEGHDLPMGPEKNDVVNPRMQPKIIILMGAMFTVPSHSHGDCLWQPGFPTLDPILIQGFVVKIRPVHKSLFLGVTDIGGLVESPPYVCDTQLHPFISP